MTHTPSPRRRRGSRYGSFTNTPVILLLISCAVLLALLLAEWNAVATAQIMTDEETQVLLDQDSYVGLIDDDAGLMDIPYLEVEEEVNTGAEEEKEEEPVNIPVVPARSDRRVNHWAVVVGGSRYFFNYRHSANALTFYHLLRQHGIDDDHILLFLSDAFACDPRNPFPATVYSSGASRTASETVRIRTDPDRRQQENLYGCSAQVDYAGDDVDVRRFLNVMQGRYDANTPPTRRLLSDENSNILIYIAGHGAKANFKFQDSEFLSSTDISETLSMMHAQRRYNNVLFLADTCHALALCESIRAPNVVCLASSDGDHDSYSSNHDMVLGMQLTSQWTFETLKMLEDTNCSDPRKGAIVPSTGPYRGISPLFQSLYEFTYTTEKNRLPGARSSPAHRGAVNDPQAMHQWTMADFLCASPTKTSPVEVYHDLF